jgi:hypothetical protein
MCQVDAAGTKYNNLLPKKVPNLRIKWFFTEE